MTRFSHVSVHRSHVDAEVDQAVRVAPLVVIPGHELDEALVQRDARLDVKDRRELGADEVRAHNLFDLLAQHPWE